MQRKRIGILTSGGDCSGLNSVIRSAYIRSKILGFELIGIKKGLKGLGERPLDFTHLTDEMCNESLLTKSGSIILSNTKPMKKPDGSEFSFEESAALALGGYKELGLSGLIYVGGDGSITIMTALLTQNPDIKIIAIPKTIDNDVSNTDISIGFTTAVEVVCESIENIRSTAMSHERVMVVEVMGRDAGFIALHSGIASGADVILMPEFKYNEQKLIDRVRMCYESGKNHCIIVVSEAVESENLKHDVVDLATYSNQKLSRTTYNGIGENIASLLKSNGFDSRAVVLGHTQRGGKTSVIDRVIGAGFGAQAVNLLAEGKGNLMMSYHNGNITPIPISEVAKSINRGVKKDDMCINIAKNLGIYIGEL